MGPYLHGLRWLQFLYQHVSLRIHLPERIPGMEEPGGLPSMGSHTVGHDWSNLATAAAASLRKEKSKRKIPSSFQEYFWGYCMHYFQLHPTGQNSFMCFYLLVTWNSLSYMATKLAKNQGFYHHWEELLLLGKIKSLSQTPQLLLLWVLLFSILVTVFPKDQSLVLYSSVSTETFLGYSQWRRSIY